MATTGKPRKTAVRVAETIEPQIESFRAQHLNLAQHQIATEFGRTRVTVDEAESPLAWLARRRGRDGRPLIEPHQLQAGERLRADFTRANLMPRTTSNWGSPIASDIRASGGNRAGAFTDTMIAARQCVHQALDAVGPEFAGLLIDVCCFLKGLEDIERERVWPARSAKVVLQLALDRLARHYGYAAQAKGRSQALIRTWLADGATFSVDGA
ncbi:MAG: DNA replication protein [Deltaproteobacteria bacterium]|nr:DNA replication protein [Deltaproteobacteria bacterium]